MKIRLAASILALLTAIGFGISGTLYTHSLCHELSSQAKTAAEQYDLQSLNSVKQKWDSKVSLLSAFIPHEHIDELTESLGRAIAYIKCDNRDEFDAEISSVVHLFGIIGSYDAPTFRALF